MEKERTLSYDVKIERPRAFLTLIQPYVKDDPRANNAGNFYQALL